MGDLNDLKFVLQSEIPIVIVETSEEERVVSLFDRVSGANGHLLFRWTITSGLRRLDSEFAAQRFNTKPIDVLHHIKSTSRPGIYLLLDFHPYLEDPVTVRVVREIAQEFDSVPKRLIFISHTFETPAELRHLTTRFELSLPDAEFLVGMITDIAREFMQERGSKVSADKTAVRLLARNLTGLTITDASRLARNAIFDDGAITPSDMRHVMKAKYDLIDQAGAISFEYDTASFGDVGGLENLKNWLELRRRVFMQSDKDMGVDPPKGILLLGVQGCGKSLAAKAVAGVWDIPLLRLDFGTLFNKYYGETEKNLRQALKSAEVMAPCVLWMDEIEKGLSQGDDDDGVSRRVLGTFLTWMAERDRPVFLVATANDISALPPELMRKGRFDEIFFVDLPRLNARYAIFSIQLRRRKLDPDTFDLHALASQTSGFSGSEIEQAIVSALYTTIGTGMELSTRAILQEIENTRPLSVVMAERITALREWASTRTVPANAR